VNATRQYAVLAFEGGERVGTWRANNLPNALGTAVGVVQALWLIPETDVLIETVLPGQEYTLSSAGRVAGYRVTIRRIG
jgi:hypothetical protein